MNKIQMVEQGWYLQQISACFGKLHRRIHYHIYAMFHLLKFRYNDWKLPIRRPKHCSNLSGSHLQLPNGQRLIFLIQAIFVQLIDTDDGLNKKAQLSLTNPRDAKACQKLLQFDVLTTLSLTILAYLHSFSCWCVRNLRNPAKFTENSSL